MFHLNYKKYQVWISKNYDVWISKKYDVWISKKYDLYYIPLLLRTNCDVNYIINGKYHKLIQG